MINQTVTINCPECGEDIIYKFKDFAEWGVSCNHNKTCEGCGSRVAISLNIGCPEDIGVPENWTREEE